VTPLHLDSAFPTPLPTHPLVSYTHTPTFGHSHCLYPIPTFLQDYSYPSPDWTHYCVYTFYTYITLPLWLPFRTHALPRGFIYLPLRLPRTVHTFTTPARTHTRAHTHTYPHTHVLYTDFILRACFMGHTRTHTHTHRWRHTTPHCHICICLCGHTFTPYHPSPPYTHLHTFTPFLPLCLCHGWTVGSHLYLPFTPH